MLDSFVNLRPYIQGLIILAMSGAVGGFFWLIFYLLKNFKDAKIKYKDFELSGSKQDNLEALLTQERLIINEIHRIETLETISEQMKHAQEVLDKNLADHFRAVEACYDASRRSEEEKAEYRKNYGNFIANLKGTCLSLIRDVFNWDEKFKTTENGAAFNNYAKEKTKSMMSSIRSFVSSMAPNTDLQEVINRRKKAVNMAQYEFLNILLEGKDIYTNKQKKTAELRKSIEERIK